MARLIFMTDFSESYAIGLLQGILNYSRRHEPWVVCKMPLSFRDKHGIQEVVSFALRWKADAIIGQFYDTDDVSLFVENGIIAIAQNYQSDFTNIPNITGEHKRGGSICADYFIKRGYKNFAFYGLRGMVWSDERREGFCDEVTKRIKSCTINVQEGFNLANTWWYDISTLTLWLESLPKPVAILACDDCRAYHIIEASQQSKNIHIPDDISILGIDNDKSICLLSSPQISSLNQNTEQAGYDTAKMIEKALQLPPEKKFNFLHNIVTKVTFITTRNSTDAYIHDNPIISKVLTFINHNINKKITVTDIVSIVNMSRRLLETTFRKEMGISIYQYILKMKVGKMTELFMDGYSIQETSQELDIIDIKGMSRTFKKHTGMSPSEFCNTKVPQNKH